MKYKFYYDVNSTRYIITTLLGCFGMMFVSESFLVFIPAVLFVAFVSYVFWDFIDNRRILHLFKNLNENNEVSRVYQELRKVSDTYPYNKRKGIANKRIILSTYLLSSAAILGRWDEFEILLNKIDVNYSDLKMTPINKIAIKFHRIGLMIEREKFHEAEISLEEMKNWLADNRKDRNYQLIWDSYYKRMLLYRIKKGDYPNEFEMLDTYIDWEKPNQKSLGAMWLKGRCLFYQKKFDEAKELFEYVIENGNEIAAVSEAKEYLLKCK